MRISDWSSDVCSSDLADVIPEHGLGADAHLFVRPENTRLTRPGQSPSLQFQGRITQMLFVGTHYKLVLDIGAGRSEEHTSELQSLMRISYAVFCLKKKTRIQQNKVQYQAIQNNK